MVQHRKDNKENIMPTKPVRDQAAINRKHAVAKKEYIRKLKEEANMLKEENERLLLRENTLKLENERLNNELIRREEKYELDRIDWHRAINAGKVLIGLDYEWAYKLKLKGMPTIKKETRMASIVEMVGAAIVSLMAVIMYKTQPITRLRAICMALFGSFIFGVHEMKLVLHNLIRKYIRAEVFVAWKILKAMDLAPKGSLNYRGIETLRQVECLEKWEQGLLPSSSTIKEQA